MTSNPFIQLNEYQAETVADALVRVVAALKSHTDSFNEANVRDSTWNPEAHISVTLTIADARAIYAACKALGVKA